MKKFVIFDLDGTLLNTLNSIAFCGNKGLEKFGFAPVDVSVYPDFIGNGAPVLIEKLYKYVGGDMAHFDEFLKYTLSVYDEYGNKNITVFDGIESMLLALKDKGIKCAVLSNKPHNITVDVCKSFFGNSFACVYGHRQDKPKKPDPTVIFDILKETGYTKDECVYCGDSTVDVETAKNAGIAIFGAAWGFYGKEPFENADAVLDTPQDILKYI